MTAYSRLPIFIAGLLIASALLQAQTLAPTNVTHVKSGNREVDIHHQGPPAPPPDTPDNFQIAGQTATQLTLTWDAASAASHRTVDHYEIWLDGIKLLQTQETDAVVSYDAFGPTLQFFSVRTVDNTEVASLPSDEILAPRPPREISIESKLVMASRVRDGFVGLKGENLYKKGTYAYHYERSYDWFNVFNYSLYEDWSIAATYDPDHDKWALDVGTGGIYREATIYFSAPSDPPRIGKWILDNPTTAILVTPDGTRISNATDIASGIWRLGDRGTYAFRNYVINGFASPDSDTSGAWSGFPYGLGTMMLTLEDEIPSGPSRAGVASDYGVGLGLLPTLNWGAAVEVSFGTSKLTDGIGNDFNNIASRVDSNPTVSSLSGGEYRLHVDGTGTRTLDWAEVTTHDDGSTPTVLLRHESINLDQTSGYTQTYAVSPPAVAGSTNIRILSGQISMVTPSHTATPASPQRLYLANDLFAGESGTVNIVPGSGWFAGDGTNHAIITYSGTDEAIKLVAVDPGVIGRGGDVGGAVASGYEVPSGTDLMLVENMPGFRTLGGWLLVAVGLKPGVVTVTVELGSAGAEPTYQNFTLTVYATNILAVDANRDGQIKFASEEDSDQTSAGQPFRFWLNDDVDRTHTVDGNDSEEDDIGGAEVTGLQPDWQSNYIQSKRDLEDFARLQISVAGLNDPFKNGQLYLGLKWANVTDTPAIKLYKHVENDGGTRYLTDDAIALQQISAAYAISDIRDTATQPQTATRVVVEGTDVFVLPSSLFSGLSEAQPKLSLLFEGCKVGQGQLQFVILKKDGADYIEIGNGPGVWMDLKKIGDMYEHWSVGNTGGGVPDSVGARIPSLTGSGTTFNYDAGSPSPEERKYILYVHGWNMQRWEKERFAETAFKRLWLQGYKGRFGLFSWPTTNGFGGLVGDETKLRKFISTIYSAASDSTNYDRGEWTAWRSAPMLADLFTTLNESYPGQVNVVAHSMGNIVAGEALRLLAKRGAHNVVACYVASQAAVPSHTYDGAQPDSLTAEILGAPLPQSIDGGYPQTPNIYKNWLAANGAAVGRRVNFYNVNDFALWHDSWETNQWLKPDGIDQPYQPWDYAYAGADFNVLDDQFQKRGLGTVTVGFKGHITSTPGPLVLLKYGDAADPKDRYEIMAFAAESRSKAMGATADLFNASDSVNLQTVWGNDPSSDTRPFSRHKWHSAEFRSNNMRQAAYWNTLLGSQGFDILPTP